VSSDNKTRKEQLSPLGFSMNDEATRRSKKLLERAGMFGVEVHQDCNSACVIDAGVNTPGSLAAGVEIAEICMGGMGKVDLLANNRLSRWAFDVNVTVGQAVIGCLGAQYAGWSLSAAGDDDSGDKWRGMASGPGRALALKEELFDELGFRDGVARKRPGAVLVIEADRLPPPALAEKIAADCDVQLSDLTLIVTPTGSFAGVVQIAARVVEVALHKAHTVAESAGIELSSIREGIGSTPLPPPGSDGLAAMGRTNDTILFAGTVHLFVDADDSSCSALAKALPSSNSNDYGKPFAQVFTDYDYDFFKVDPALFSPAHVRITSTDTGNTFEAGGIDEALLLKSFSVSAV